MRSFLLLSLLFSLSSAWAQSFTISPLFGVEHTQSRYPEPARSSSKTFFGLRVLAGVPLFSGELEGTQSNGSRTYSGDNQKIDDQIQRIMVGVRSTFDLNTTLAFFLRAGGRGTKEKTTITDTATDEKEVKEPPLYWDPYAGTGVHINLAQLLQLNLGATWIFIDGKRPDVQYTFGFTVKFGQTR
jgi:hypothetical protein